MPKWNRTAIVGAVGATAVAIAIFSVLRSSERPLAGVAEEDSSSHLDRSKLRLSKIQRDRSNLTGATGRDPHINVAPEVPGWHEIAAALTPSKAKELLERDRQEETNSEIRAKNAARIIGQLCRNGFTNEAWGLIEADPGIVREKALGGFFQEAALPEDELISRLSALQKKERVVGLVGYWERFEPESFVGMDLGKFGLHTTEDRVALRQTFESMLAKAFDSSNPEVGKLARQDLLKFAVDQTNAGLLVFSDIGKILQKDSSKDGFAYWDALVRIDPALRQGQDSLKGTDALIIQAMTVQDPERTLNMTLTEGTPARGKGYVALEKWLTQDFNKAEEWYHRNADRADPDSSAVAFMRACATRGDFQTALDWYEKIQSESWKNGIGGEMRSIQRRLAGESNQ